MAGALLAQGVRAAEISGALGDVAEAVESVPLLATVARDARLQTPTLESLAALVEGRIAPELWTQTLIEPSGQTLASPVRAA